MSKDVIEISFDDLGLTKPLEKMTAKELRQLAVEKIPSITGANAMSKEDLVTAIKEIFGIVEEEGVSPYKEQILSLKRRIKELRAEKEKVEARKDRDKLRREINKLKKRTRRLARSV